jgi:hypothetical protein
MTAKKRIAKAKNRERRRLHGIMGRPAWTPFQSNGIHTTTIILNEGDAYDDCAEVFLNSRYKVAKYDDGEIIHLSIKRLDGQALQDWRELQRIKNELLGVEAEAVQLHPAESRLLDMCDQVHLWALRERRFAFGFEERIVSEGTVLLGQTQRPFERKPADLQCMEDLIAVGRPF